MRNRMGTTDRIIRIILGLAIIFFGLYFQSWWGLIGLLPLITGLTKVCLVYSLFGISTNKVKPAS